MRSTKNLGLYPILLLMLGMALFAWPITITGAEGRQVHWRSTSAQRASPYHDYGPYAEAPRYRPARLNARDARINQLNPNLRGNDGNLGERLSGIQTGCKAGAPDLDSWFGIVGGAPSAERRRHRRQHRFPHGRR